MATSATRPPAIDAILHRFTTDEYHKMAEVGILHEDDRVELIEGGIVDMAPIGDRHVLCVARLSYLMTIGLDRKAFVLGQSPLRLHEHSEPGPDLILLRWRPDFYTGMRFSPADTLLVVEVADSSLAYDREVKVPLYARAGLPEAWLVDLNGESIRVHRDPGPDGYRTVFAIRGEEKLYPHAFPEFVLTAAQILG